MISDISRGLFHKAIMMSGTALNPWVSHFYSRHFSSIANEINSTVDGTIRKCSSKGSQIPGMER